MGDVGGAWQVKEGSKTNSERIFEEKALHEGGPTTLAPSPVGGRIVPDAGIDTLIPVHDGQVAWHRAKQFPVNENVE